MGEQKMFRTINDLLAYYYGGSSDILKADDPLLTTTTGVYNPIYGANVWFNLSTEANVFGVLPKSPWNHAGWRILTATPTYPTGVSEGGNISDSVKGTYTAVVTKPKQVDLAFENSYVAEDLVGKDDMASSFDMLLAHNSLFFKDMVNTQLCLDNQTTAGNRFESIDRIVASNGEISTNGLAANSVDIYGLDRDSGTTYDCYVDTASSNRVLTEEMLRTAALTTQKYGANPNGQVWITGYDTASEIISLFEDRIRYVPTTQVSIGVNGIETLAGQETGVQVQTLYGRPLIVSKQIATDSGGVSRIYLLDTSDPEKFGQPRFSIKILRPVMFFKTENPFMLGKYTIKGVFYMSGETIATYLKGQAKIRNLKA